MIINDSNLMDVRRLPPEDDPPTVVDPDTMEALEIAFEELETISRRRPQVPQFPSGVQHVQLLQRGP
jgi:hypothetical protein